MMPRLVLLVLLGTLTIWPSSHATTYRSMPEMAIFKHFEGRYAEESDPAESGDHVILESNGSYYGRGNHFHLRRKITLVDAHTEFFEFWVFTYDAKERVYLAWRFDGNMSDPRPVAYEGEWDKDRKELKLTDVGGDKPDEHRKVTLRAP